MSTASVEAEPAADFAVHLDNFEGPFDLLLQLIAKHQLDITEVALSRVTDEFVAHIQQCGPDWDLEQTTSFLVVAATLLDLKIVRLLPAAEIEDEEDLALLEARDLLFARLLQYKAFKQVAGVLSQRMAEVSRRVPRAVGLEPRYADILPDVVINVGLEQFAAVAAAALQPKEEPVLGLEHLHAPQVSVREQGATIAERLQRAGSSTFRSLTADSPDLLTTVARFLALLELYRMGRVAFDQLSALGELHIRWTGGDAEFDETLDEYDMHAETDPDEDAGTADGEEPSD